MFEVLDFYFVIRGALFCGAELEIAADTLGFRADL